jgi:hypothetical protein
MNTAHSPSIVNSSASASWLPLCLPKYNSSGFVNVFITFLQSEHNSESSATAPDSKAKSKTGQPVEPSSPTRIGQEEDTAKADPFLTRRDTNPGVDVGLLCVTANGDFESIRDWCSIVIGVRTSFLCLADRTLLGLLAAAARKRWHVSEYRKGHSQWIDGVQRIGFKHSRPSSFYLQVEVPRPDHGTNLRRTI